MKLISVLLFIFCLGAGGFGQKITVFENAPFIESAAIQQMKNFAEFENSYFYTSTSFKTNNLGDNVLVKVNKITGKVESNDQVPIGVNASSLTATEKYIYYPYFGSGANAIFYSLKRFDPKTNVHEIMKNASGKDVLFSSSLIKLAGLYSYKDNLVTVGTTEGLKAMPYAKYSSNILPDSAKFMGNNQIAYSQGANHLFYMAQVPTENTLTINRDGLYYFVNNPTLHTFDLRFSPHNGGKTLTTQPVRTALICRS